MRNIQIIRGSYSYRPEGSKITTIKTRADDPFAVSDAEAKRLVNLKVAKYAAAPAAPAAPAVDNTQKPEYDANTNANTLRALMKAVGLSAKVGVPKEDMVAALDEFYGIKEDDPVDDRHDEDDDEDDEDNDSDDEGDGTDSDEDDKPPPLGAADPVT